MNYIRGLMVAALLAGCGGQAPLTEAEQEYCSSIEGGFAAMDIATEKGRNPFSGTWWSKENAKRGEYSAEYIEDCREAYERFGS